MNGTHSLPEVSTIPHLSFFLVAKYCFVFSNEWRTSYTKGVMFLPLLFINPHFLFFRNQKELSVQGIISTGW